MTTTIGRPNHTALPEPQHIALSCGVPAEHLTTARHGTDGYLVTVSRETWRDARADAHTIARGILAAFDADPEAGAVSVALDDMTERNRVCWSVLVKITR